MATRTASTISPSSLAKLAADAEKLDVTLVRELAGVKAKPWTFHIRIAPPK